MAHRDEKEPRSSPRPICSPVKENFNPTCLQSDQRGLHRRDQIKAPIVCVAHRIKSRDSNISHVLQGCPKFARKQGIALWVLDRVTSNWVSRQRVTRCTASLLLFQTAPGTEISTPIFDNLRGSVELAKETVSRAIYDNNGISPKHLRHLFYPLGIDAD